MRYFVTLPSQDELTIDIEHLPTGGTRIKVDGTPLDVDGQEADGAWSVRVGNRVLDLWLDGEPPELHFVASGARLDAHVESERSRMNRSAGTGGARGGQVMAPMPGRVVKLLVAEGERVEPGRAVIVVEAMKMENELTSDVAGTVREVCARPGEHVDGGAVLLRIE